MRVLGLACRDNTRTRVRGAFETAAALVEQHLNFCDGCERYVDQMRPTIATVGRIRDEDVPDETRRRLLAAFREWKRS